MIETTGGNIPEVRFTLSSGEKERINKQAKPRRSSSQPDFSFGASFLLRVAIFKRFIYVGADFHPCRNNNDCTTVSTVTKLPWEAFLDPTKVSKSADVPPCLLSCSWLLDSDVLWPWLPCPCCWDSREPETAVMIEMHWSGCSVPADAVVALSYCYDYTSRT